MGAKVGSTDSLHEGLADAGIKIGALSENHALPAYRLMISLSRLAK